MHYLRYLGGNLMVIAAGFVSFPVMTRLLDNHQFGILGYYEAWLLVIAGLLKLGAQHAILRFYPHQGGVIALRRFRTDYLLLPFALSMSLWLVCAASVVLMIDRFPADDQPILWVLILTLPLLIWSSFVEAVMYALERSDISLWLKIAWRWSELALVLLTIAMIERSALGVFSARLVVLIVVAAWLTLWFRRWCRGRITRPSRAPVVAGLAFGVPMMFTELVSVLFGFADRILLRTLTGSFTEVGIYTIGYGLAMAVAAVMGKTLDEAFLPTALRLYKASGAQAVVELKRDMLDVWVLAVGLATALLLCVGQDLLILLAGKDKAASAPVFVAIAIGMVWNSLFTIAQYGLLLQRRALRVLVIMLTATVLNLLLNVPLILAWGVTGAVVATLLSYGFLALVQLWQCPSELRYLPPVARLASAALFAPIMLGLLVQIEYFGAESPFARLLAGTVTVLLPALVLAAMDGKLRAGIKRFLAAMSKS
ncbi:lipopolysaccharide biosynthesis protein [Wenzhouxiangella sp. EGI_FJ10305]|uniref:lipopolysaccharide biosynthesis protein n=1 Tax=Wenzhouxiangella sp. EGI_FJ10305 TaxID=3243768 RepID=UPI0035D870A8